MQKASYGPTPVDVSTRYPGIVRRGGRYSVRFRDRQGKSRRASAATIGEALDLQARYRSGGYEQAGGRVAFREFAAEWCDTYSGSGRHGIRPATMAEYRRVIERRAIPFFGNQRLDRIEPRDVRRFATTIAARQVRRRGTMQPVSGNTVRLHLAAVRLVLAQAVADGILYRNPATGVRAAQAAPGASETSDALVLTDEQVEAIISATPKPWQLLIRVLDGTGLRISEALALEWDDIDLGRKVLHVRRRLYEGTIAPPKSRYGTRTIPLPTSLCHHLWTAHATRRGQLVFPDQTGSYASANNLRRRTWTKATTAAGVPDAGFHDLRHTYGSRLFAAGWNVLAISRVLGHHSPSFTLRTYIHAITDDLPSIDLIDREGSATTVPADRNRPSELVESTGKAHLPAILP